MGVWGGAYAAKEVEMDRVGITAWQLRAAVDALKELGLLRECRAPKVAKHFSAQATLVDTILALILDLGRLEHVLARKALPIGADAEIAEHIRHEARCGVADREERSGSLPSASETQG